jgi:hypothetical protein
MPLTFSQRPRRRSTLTGSKIREWKSADGRYLVVQIINPWYGTWFRAVRQYANGQAFVSESRHRTREAAIAACAKHRSE